MTSSPKIFDGITSSQALRFAMQRDEQRTVFVGGIGGRHVFGLGLDAATIEILAAGNMLLTTADPTDTVTMHDMTLSFTNVSNVALKNIRFVNCNLQFTNCSDVILSNCLFRGHRYGHSFTTFSECTDVVVDGCYFFGDNTYNCVCGMYTMKRVLFVNNEFVGRNRVVAFVANWPSEDISFVNNIDRTMHFHVMLEEMMEACSEIHVEHNWIVIPDDIMRKRDYRTLVAYLKKRPRRHLVMRCNFIKQGRSSLALPPIVPPGGSTLCASSNSGCTKKTKLMRDNETKYRREFAPNH